MRNEIISSSFPIVHLATHGGFSSNPENTFILAWDKTIPTKDFEQILSSTEHHQSNPINLLVLNAAQTAQGDNQAPFGLAGLAIRSGVHSVIATQGGVSDNAAAKLMVQFYKKYSEPNITKAGALRSAQLALIRDTDDSFPFY